jgi:hypothetical protein
MREPKKMYFTFTIHTMMHLTKERQKHLEFNGDKCAPNLPIRLHTWERSYV